MKDRPISYREKSKELRAQYLEKRRSIPSDLKAEMDARICKSALNLASFRFSKVVLLYAPIKGEIDLMPFAREAMAKGKAVAFPRCNTADHTMTYHFVRDLDELVPGAMNIPEPREDAPIYDPESDLREAVCFIPALIYDEGGYRVGYGGGYYDRYLRRFSGSKVGVIYSDFIVKKVPRGRFDMKCDIMLTEKNVRIPHEG